MAKKMYCLHRSLSILCKKYIKEHTSNDHDSIQKRNRGVRGHSLILMNKIFNCITMCLAVSWFGSHIRQVVMKFT